MAEISPVPVDEVRFLKARDTLFTFDFRALGEDPSYRIPAMWKYENLTPWIALGWATVNEDAALIAYRSPYKQLVVPKGDDPTISLYRRLKAAALDRSIRALWVAVPHPDADEFALQKGLRINYSYKQFLRLNDKLEQKKLLRDLTPRWRPVGATKELKGVASGYLKRRHGSGGFTVFKASEMGSSKVRDLLAAQPSDWYFEETASGVPHSVQGLRSGGRHVVFGFSEQCIEDGRYFKGSRILPLANLTAKVAAQLSAAIDRLEPLFSGYEGFWGIDFILDEDETVKVLEANVRVTAATIPTLMVNFANASRALYREDVPPREAAGSSAIILTVDPDRAGVDVLKFQPNETVLDKSTLLGI